jgi:hypothetical protein
MQKWINIKNETYLMIASAAVLPFKSIGIQLKDGTWNVLFKNDTLDRITAFAFDGESFDDTIQRLRKG